MSAKEVVSKLASDAKARIGIALSQTSISTAAAIVFCVLVFVFISVLAMGVLHLQQNDPRAEGMMKVIGTGATLIGIMFVVLKGDLIANRQLKTQAELRENTEKTARVEQKISKVDEQTNGGLEKRMRSIIKDELKGFVPADELKQFISGAISDAMENIKSSQK